MQGKRRIPKIVLYHGSYSVIYFLKINDGMTEEDAQDLFYESQTYGKLADEGTELYMKSWEDIYEMLKKEGFTA